MPLAGRPSTLEATAPLPGLTVYARMNPPPRKGSLPMDLLQRAGLLRLTQLPEIAVAKVIRVGRLGEKTHHAVLPTGFGARLVGYGERRVGVARNVMGSGAL